MFVGCLQTSMKGLRIAIYNIDGFGSQGSRRSAIRRIRRVATWLAGCLYRSRRADRLDLNIDTDIDVHREIKYECVHLIYIYIHVHNTNNSKSDDNNSTNLI